MKKNFLVLSLLTLASVSSPLLAATDVVITPPMVTIKGGKFSMGSTANPKTCQTASLIFQLSARGVSREIHRSPCGHWIGENFRDAEFQLKWKILCAV
ncbi:formylglycine-generating enzyme required for sulfatase activity [Undibacterium sp. GrIS 1.8]|uniref:hypothetical protein n=1 Tax=Undibacterium sp. GrIS 1.8 TaxID=3143934 RepID=UPI0033979BF0